MSLTNLKYFIVTAEELNFTRASKRLYISQQALSNHIAKLERQYQIALFDRGSPMTLTDAGRILYKSAKEALETMEQCERQLQDMKDFTMGKLCIGIPVTRGTAMLPNLCSAFHQMYPKVHLEIYEGRTSQEVKEAMLQGKIDLMIGYTSFHPNHIVSVPLFTEKYVLVAPNQLLKNYFSSNQIFQMHQHPQSMRTFANCPFVAQAPNTMGGQIFRAICDESKLNPYIVMTTQNLLTELALCIAGMGVCTIPSTFVLNEKYFSSFHQVQSSSLFGQESWSRVTIFQMESTIGSKPVGINRLCTKTLTQAGQKFIDLAKAMYFQPNIQPSET
ncbi:LysR family transcriptional regulator [Caproicibacterium sp. BJN0003]|uniref:LysR family transcriptional regulator n=1 Tax=Caproicibacterium sp. BJN0003 TaxID=2994078 RepID=UPI002254214D|nr:LysR family transcriptional regulator [Caproicibacterium sp. BJN0003]UZT82592.1 LysR family transcriptional regulator [Caproicibacterium sp. BJN0003]